MANKEMERKGPQALNDEDLKQASGGTFYEGIFPPDDPRWEKFKSRIDLDRGEDLDTSLRRRAQNGRYNKYGLGENS